MNLNIIRLKEEDAAQLFPRINQLKRKKIKVQRKKEIKQKVVNKKRMM
jgi:hypothetical protein